MSDAVENPPPAPPKPTESVWDFPRPPRLEQVDWRIRVVFAGETIVDSPIALRVLETSQAPAYYVPFQYVNDNLLRPNAGRQTFCEWKGLADYADIVVGDRIAGAGGLELRAAVGFIRVVDRPLGVLRAIGRRVLGRRRPGRTQRGRLLRRLDHVQRHRPLQGRPWHPHLVTCRLGSDPERQVTSWRGDATRRLRRGPTTWWPPRPPSGSDRRRGGTARTRRPLPARP